MGILVKSFDEHKAKEVIKTCPKIVKDYVKLLNGANTRRRQMLSKALLKIKDQTIEIERLKSEVKNLSVG